jgi:hypothetical protein
LLVVLLLMAILTGVRWNLSNTYIFGHLQQYTQLLQFKHKNFSFIFLLHNLHSTFKIPVSSLCHYLFYANNQ